jgi:F1F0 ATPase subunit 2
MISMNELCPVLLAALAGLALGAGFFAGLWWTVRRGLASPRPALWFFCSLLVRLSLTLAGFYGVAGDDWRRLLACLLGFLLARLLVARLTRATPATEAAVHAP